MTIEQNIQDRKQAEQLFQSMLDIARDDFKALSTHGRLVFFQTAYYHFAKRLGLNQPKPQLKQPVSNDPSLDKQSEQAIEDLNNLIALCEDVPESGSDFANDVAESANNMIVTIQEMRRVTDKQLQTIDNWTSGVSKWLR